MTEHCPRDGKKLDHNGECLNCEFKAPAMVGMPMTQPEVKELVAEVRRRNPLSPKCLGRMHHRCRVLSCGCNCGHKEWAAALRREAAEVEHSVENADDSGVYEAGRLRAEELRRRADEVGGRGW